MSEACYSDCAALYCYANDNQTAFKQTCVKQNLSSDLASTICLYYSSLSEACESCRIYSYMFQFEPSVPVLRALHLLLLSGVLILLLIILIFVIYYNAYLAFRAKPPFRVNDFCPQLLFPRGIVGLGQYNFEEETFFEQELLNQQKPKIQR